MKANSSIHLFLILTLSFFIISCSSNKKCVSSQKKVKEDKTLETNKKVDSEKIDKDFESMKAELFKKSEHGYTIPIYADAPSDDYSEFKDGKFPFQVKKDKIVLLDKYKEKLEPFIMKNIDESDSWVYLATYFQYKAMIPKLKTLILKCDKFHGWEGPDYSKVETFLQKEMYPHQNAYIEAIKYITKKSAKDALNLSEAELKEMKTKASLCVATNKDTMENSCCNKRLLEKVINR